MPFRRAPDQSSCDDHVLTRAEGSRLVRSRRRIVGSYARTPLAISTRGSSCSTSCGPRRCSRTCSKLPRSPPISRKACCSPSTTCFSIDPLSDAERPVQGERSIRLVQQIDDYVAAYPTAPIYTADLAGEFGVSIRTLGGAVSKVRGMSLHQYIRLKRLWATRAQPPQGAGAPPSPHARAPKAFTIWASLPQLTARHSTKRRRTRWHGAGKPVRRQADQTRLRPCTCGARRQGNQFLRTALPKQVRRPAATEAPRAPTRGVFLAVNQVVQGKECPSAAIVLFLIIGALVVTAAVLGYNLYQTKKQPDGLQINVGPNGLKIQGK